MRYFKMRSYQQENTIGMGPEDVLGYRNLEIPESNETVNQLVSKIKKLNF